MAISEYQTSHRHPGEMDALGVDSLPPTPITAAAEKTLREWGLSAQHIAELRDFCASFRYDRCLEKLQRLTSHPCLLQKKGDVEKVILPYFYDAMGWMSGQCRDIGQQFLVQVQVRGLMEDINEEAQLPPGCRIVPSYCTGRSRTHFTMPGNHHIWNGLVLLDDQDREVSSVLIDAAFQIITTDRESGYTRGSRTLDPPSMNTDVSQTMEVGWLEITDASWRGRMPPSPTVLGASNDRKYIYAMVFVKMGEQAPPEEKPQVVLIRIHADSNQDYFFIDKKDDSLLHSPLAGELLEEEENEIQGLLDECARFTFTTIPPTASPAISSDGPALDLTHHITWGDAQRNSL